jgi:hypothetical protein
VAAAVSCVPKMSDMGEAYGLRGSWCGHTKSPVHAVGSGLSRAAVLLGQLLRHRVKRQRVLELRVLIQPVYEGDQKAGHGEAAEDDGRLLDDRRYLWVHLSCRPLPS